MEREKGYLEKIKEDGKRKKEGGQKTNLEV